MGNTKLVPYGIFTEHAEYRFHVCPIVQRVYVYKSSDLIDLIKNRRYPVKSIWICLNGTMTCTSIGYVVPVEDIPSVRWFKIPQNLMVRYRITKKQTTSEKGKRAEKIVIEMIRQGLITKLPATTPTKEQNIQGVDLCLDKKTIQIKCDFAGGHSELGGTGNLFIQTSECNPYRQIA